MRPRLVLISVHEAGELECLAAPEAFTRRYSQDISWLGVRLAQYNRLLSVKRDMQIITPALGGHQVHLVVPQILRKLHTDCRSAQSSPRFISAGTCGHDLVSNLQMHSSYDEVIVDSGGLYMPIMLAFFQEEANLDAEIRAHRG